MPTLRSSLGLDQSSDSPTLRCGYGRESKQITCRPASRISTLAANPAIPAPMIATSHLRCTGRSVSQPRAKRKLTVLANAAKGCCGVNCGETTRTRSSPRPSRSSLAETTPCRYDPGRGFPWIKVTETLANRIGTVDRTNRRNLIPNTRSRKVATRRKVATSLRASARELTRAPGSVAVESHGSAWAPPSNGCSKSPPRTGSARGAVEFLNL